MSKVLTDIAYVVRAVRVETPESVLRRQVMIPGTAPSDAPLPDVAKAARRERERMLRAAKASLARRQLDLFPKRRS